MAQFVVMGIGTVVNALAFSGANSLLSMSTEAERKKKQMLKKNFKKI